jgi:hypothetical protein
MQDVVADAMTVEAVPIVDANGTPLPEAQVQRMHVTVQTLGRIAIIGGSALVAGLGGWLAKSLSYMDGTAAVALSGCFSFGIQRRDDAAVHRHVLRSA